MDPGPIDASRMGLVLEALQHLPAGATRQEIQALSGEVKP